MGCIGSRVALFRSCSLTSGSHSGSLTSSSGALDSIGPIEGETAAEAAARRAQRRANTFSVQNVDDTGHGVSPGKLEVTTTDLVLHVKGKLPLSWPLKSLRRYGFDNDLFSFESGRRCPTGAGIFAFRCHRAHSLFNLLQSKIQGGAQAQGQGQASAGAVSVSLPTLPSTPITPTSSAAVALNTSASAINTPVGSTFVYVNLSENNSRIISTCIGFPPPIPLPCSGIAVGGTGDSPFPGPLISAGSSKASTLSRTTPASKLVPAAKAPTITKPTPITKATPVSKTTAASKITVVSKTTTAVSTASAVATVAPVITRGPVAASKPSLTNHPVYMNVDSQGGALFAAAAATTATTSFTTTHTNIPPPTAPRRVSTSSSEKSHTQGPSTTAHSSQCSLHATCAPGGTLPDCALYSNVFCNQNPQKGAIAPAFPLVGSTTSGGGIVLPLPIQQEPAELNYAELDLKTTDRPSSSSSHNSPYSSATGRVGLFNKHHQLISTYSRTAEPYNMDRRLMGSVSENLLEGDEAVAGSSSRLLDDEGAAGSSDQNNGELGYATIDFDKTAQLNNFTRSKIQLGFDDDESPKKSSLSKKLKYGTAGL